MKKKIVLLTLVSVFLLCGMVVTTVAQPRIVGVREGDWFKYGEISVNWSSNDSNAIFPPSGYEWLEMMNETEWMLLSVEDISGTTITFQTIEHYKNGTEETFGGYVDIDTGDSENMTFMAISADLDEDDALYTSGEYANFFFIDETITRVYPGPDSTRETNHINITYGPENYTIPPDVEVYHFFSMNFYWDRSTGILVEELFEEINQTGEYLTTWSSLFRITESNVWIVPEFSTWTSILLILIVFTAVIVICKRRLLKTQIH